VRLIRGGDSRRGCAHYAGKNASPLAPVDPKAFTSFSQEGDMIGQRTGGGAKMARPHFTFITLTFGFLIAYNILSWIPTNIIGKIQFGDIRLDLALPAAVISFASWAVLSLIADH
jgi:hypothetical protein